MKIYNGFVQRVQEPFDWVRYK